MAKKRKPKTFTIDLKLISHLEERAWENRISYSEYLNRIIERDFKNYERRQGKEQRQ